MTSSFPHSGQPVRPPAWLWALPVFSCGFLAFVPPIAIAARARTTVATVIAVGFTALVATGFLLVGSEADAVDTWRGDLGALIVLGCAAGSAVYSVTTARRIGWGVTAPPAVSPARVVGPPPTLYMNPNDAAIADVMLTRAKRDEARRMAELDPSLARDLCVGRPDLPRRFDDGGLVDVNLVPAEAFVRALGLTQQQADHILSVRSQLGGFSHVDDLMTLAGLEPAQFDRISDRLIIY